MNYRHAFHAGNHLDVFKHAALCLLLESLCEKPQPLAVLDTHAGLGVYDLTSDQALRTAEFEDGVGRIFGHEPQPAGAYARILHELNGDGRLALYPGSPEIVRRMLRSGDRLMACELHPDDAAALKRRYRGDRRVAVHFRDGYEAIRALLPPRERRGLVLIDPPYEDRLEAARLAAAMASGLGRWPTGVFAAWYPVKDEAPGRTLADAARRNGFPKCLRAEFLAYAADERRLRGGGLLICNAPWRLEARLGALCEALAPLLGAGAAAWTVEQVTGA